MRIVERNIKIDEIENVLQNCKIIASYPDDQPLSSCLILGFTDYNRPLHIVVAIDDLEKYLLNKKSFYFFSSKATKTYSSITYEKDAILIFGSETTGLPNIFFEKYMDRFLKIPMKKNSRCLNLSNTVAIALYEALRQNNFSF